MISKYRQFDRGRVQILPLADRVNDLHLERWMELDEASPELSDSSLPLIADRLRAAKEFGTARILMMGAHVVRAGVNGHIIELMERGSIDAIATNGAAAIHDYDLARIGATTESVARYIR